MADNDQSNEDLPFETEDEKSENARKNPADADAEEGADPGLLGSGATTHEFCVLNLTPKPLKGKVSYHAGGSTLSINVNGLKPCTLSARKGFTPMSLHNDKWQWSERGRKYQLNCYKKDRFAVVVISSYGLSVIVTATAPDKWKW